MLIFYSGSKYNHREQVKKVLTKFRRNDLTLDISKCEFEVTTTKYLGHIIDVEQGIRMDLEKAKAIRQWQTPKTVKGFHAFLGFANFITHLSKTTLISYYRSHTSLRKMFRLFSMISARKRTKILKNYF